MPDEVLYGEKDSVLPMSRRQVRTARAICYECPVRRDCLAYALVSNDAWGVWGGLTPAERQRALNKATELLAAEGITDSDESERIARVIELFDAGVLEGLVILPTAGATSG